jgi:hypothetical protein
VILNRLAALVERGLELRSPEHDAASRVVQDLVPAAADDLARRYTAFSTDRQIGNDDPFPSMAHCLRWIIIIRKERLRSGRCC